MTAAVNVNDLTFGVELEVTLPAGTCPVGGYHCGLQVPQLPPGWKAERDGSIQAGPGHVAAEIVSPVLKGADGIRQLKAVCDWLNSVGAKVNRSTGFHVHVGFAGRDLDALHRLVSLVANFEKALYAATGTRSREHGRYCRGIQADHNFVTAFRATRTARPGLCLDRYHVLNLTNLLGHGKPTVEFRVFAGTTSAVKAIGYVRLCLGIVEKALSLKKLPKWVAKTPVETSPIHRQGEGQTALTRLFYGLGWTKGREDHTYGDIQAEELPGIEATKKELMRLARKYDSRTEEQE
jgi:Putative amidoligase enzyme